MDEGVDECCDVMWVILWGVKRTGTRRGVQAEVVMGCDMADAMDPHLQR